MLADSAPDDGLKLVNQEPNVWAIRHNGHWSDLVEEVVFGLGDEHFWQATPALSNLRQFARSRRVGPYSMLGVVLAKATSSIPPDVVLPAVRGSYGSLNLYVALVGPSGSTKSTSMAAGRDYVSLFPNVPVSQPGSGEGLAKCYAYVTKQNGVRIQEGTAWSVIAFVPEVASMLSTTSRSGATLMADWRSGWSGERLGKDYADDTKRVVIMDHRYRLTYVLGVVPLLAKELFDATHVGTPQRILWLPTSDPRRPKICPEEPGRLALGAWPDRTHAKVTAVDREVSLPLLLDQPYRANDFEVLALPRTVIDLVDQEAYMALDRTFADDSDENHSLFNQLKVAASIMRLHKRSGEITELDWQLAEHLMAVSNGLREETQRLIATTTYKQQVQVAQTKGKLADTEHNAQERHAVKRVKANLIRYLTNAGGQMPSSDLRGKLHGRDREPYYDTAIAHLEADGLIGKEPIQYNGGDGHLIRLI